MIPCITLGTNKPSSRLAWWLKEIEKISFEKSEAQFLSTINYYCLGVLINNDQMHHHETQNLKKVS